MRLKIALSIVVLLLLIGAWFLFAWHWSYSEGERAGWLQEPQRALVVMPHVVKGAPERAMMQLHSGG